MFYAQGPLLIILDNTITDKKYRMRILLGVSFLNLNGNLYESLARF